MEDGGRGARIIAFAFCSAIAAFAVTISVYYLRNYKRNRKKGSYTGIFNPSSTVHEVKSLTSSAVELDLAKILKENGHGEFAKGTISSLLGMLEKVEDHMLEKLLVALLNCSAFTTNQNAIRECGGLTKLVALLKHPHKVVSIKAAQVLSNLAINETNQQSLKNSIVEVIKNLEYCDVTEDEEVVIEHLRLLVNLSATNIAHEEIMTGAQEYFNILTQSLSGQIQQQVLRLLVNLSCNSNNLEELLEFKPLLILQTFMLPDNMDDIVLRAVTITANLLSSPDHYTQQQQSMVTEHLNVLYSELTRLLDHSNQDIQSQAKRALRSIFAFRMMYTT